MKRKHTIISNVRDKIPYYMNIAILRESHIWCDPPIFFFSIKMSDKFFFRPLNICTNWKVAYTIECVVVSYWFVKKNNTMINPNLKYFENKLAIRQICEQFQQNTMHIQYTPKKNAQNCNKFTDNMHIKKLKTRLPMLWRVRLQRVQYLCCASRTRYFFRFKYSANLKGFSTYAYFYRIKDKCKQRHSYKNQQNEWTTAKKIEK